MISVQRSAFERFKIYSNAEYNKKEDSSVFKLFEIALSLVGPAGAGLSLVFKIAKDVKRLEKVVKAAKRFEKAHKIGERWEKVKEATEVVKGGREVKEKVEKLHEESEPKAQFEFQLQVINQLMEMEIKTFANLEHANRFLEKWLDDNQYAPANEDLEYALISQFKQDPEFSPLVDQVSKRTGDIAKIRIAANEASDIFELQLYQKYWVEERGAYFHYDWHGHLIDIEIMPEKVWKRICNDLNGGPYTGRKPFNQIVKLPDQTDEEPNYLSGP